MKVQELLRAWKQILSGREAVKDNVLFAPLSYYKLSVPVVALPRALSDQAEQIGEEFLQSSRGRRFLVLGYKPSYDTLDWLSERASTDYVVREIGIFEDIKVLEFVPSGAVNVSTD